MDEKTLQRFLKASPKRRAEILQAWVSNNQHNLFITALDEQSPIVQSEKLYAVLKQWVTEVLADIMPFHWVKGLDESLLKNDNRRLRRLSALFFAYFSDKHHDQKTLATLSDVDSRTIRNWLADETAWLARCITQRQQLLVAGLPPHVLSDVHEYKIPTAHTILAQLNYHPQVMLHGEGGMGKTTCALQIANQWLQTKDAQQTKLIFITLNADSPVYTQVLDELAPEKGRVIDEADKAFALIQQALALQETLVILDACEHVYNLSGAEEDIQRLLKENPSTTCILTSRVKFNMSIHVESLPTFHSVIPIMRQSWGIEHDLDARVVQQLEQISLKNPLTIKYMIDAVQKHGAQIIMDKPIDDLTAHYVIELHWQKLSESARKILIALASLKDKTSREFAMLLSGFDKKTFDEALREIISFHQPYSEQWLKLHDKEREFITKQVDGRYKLWLTQQKAALWKQMEGLISLDNPPFFIENQNNILFIAKSLPALKLASKASLSLQDWKTLAEIVKILFETGNWALITSNTGDNLGYAIIRKIENLSQIEDVQILTPLGEIIWTFVDTMTSVKIQNDKGENQNTITENHIKSITNRFNKLSETQYSPQLNALLSVATALFYFNAGIALVEAHDAIKRALNDLEDADLIAYVQGIQGLIEWRLGQENCVEPFQKAQAYYVRTGQKTRELWINSNLGLAYWTLGRLTLAKQTLEQAVTGMWYEYSWIIHSNFNVLGLVCLMQGHLQDAKQQFSKYKAYLAGENDENKQYKLKDHNMYQRIARNLGNVYLAEGNYEKAKTNLKIGITQHEKKIIAPRSECEAHLNLALCYFYEGRRYDCYDQLEQARSMAELMDNDVLKVIYLRAVGEIEADQSQIEAALALAEAAKRPIDVAGCLLQLARLSPHEQRGALISRARAILSECEATGWVNRIDEGHIPLLPLSI